MSELAIIPECFVDTNLIETLVPPVRGYNHQKGCGTVARVMQTKYKDGFSLGIIDKDKKEIKYLEEFTIITNTTSLFLYKHNSKPHYIIQIVPAVERFLINAAQHKNISLVNFGLADDLDQLKTYTKARTSKKDTNLKSAFKALVDTPDFSLLAGWVKYLHEKRYDVDIEHLKSLITLP